MDFPIITFKTYHHQKQKAKRGGEKTVSQSENHREQVETCRNRYLKFCGLRIVLAGHRSGDFYHISWCLNTQIMGLKIILIKKIIIGFSNCIKVLIEIHNTNTN